ncbi:PREDICTED: putative deoxyribonuclease tatdn3 isoform X4 [Poecilia mexicana]|uniref:putative deoxyribonuclease tatdn3 isoform X4 n=1 Tax=Poecilia mexicana TaxID=48701 RepID=UPI00072DA063|nr:PREDICTED: putative deoxyribonuclease tatdn3 isoform X4 [Poecilia mexicana]
MDYGFVDCHCHISALEFQQFLVPGSVCVLLVVTGPNVERSARSEDFRSQPSLFSSAGSSGCDPQNQVGVKTLVAVTEEVEEFSRVLRLQERYPDLVAPCLGLHPLQAAGGQRSVRPQDLEEALPLFYSHRERLVAIGEIGLDFTPWCAPTQQDRDDQMKVFIRQLDVAMEMDLPVNVHSRSAAKVTIDTMRRRGECLCPPSGQMSPDAGRCPSSHSVSLQGSAELCCITSLGSRRQLWRLWRPDSSSPSLLLSAGTSSSRSKRLGSSE